MKSLRDELQTWRRRRHFVARGRLQGQLARQYVVLGALAACLALANVQALEHLRAGLLGADGTTAGAGLLEGATVYGYGVVLAIVSCGLLALVGAIYSHRIAGPAQKIAEALERLGNGETGVRVRLREDDGLQELARALNAAAARLERGTGGAAEAIAGPAPELILFPRAPLDPARRAGAPGPEAGRA